MGLDLFLTRAINDFAGETSWIDWAFLTLCEPDTLWLPCFSAGELLDCAVATGSIGRRSGDDGINRIG
jgi:hypothetical protein